MNFFLITIMLSSLSFRALALTPETDEQMEKKRETILENCQQLEAAGLPQEPHQVMHAITDCLAPPLPSTEKKLVAK